MDALEKKYKKWNLITIGVFIIGILLTAVLVIYIDPYWHFHEPQEGISYRLGNGRYMNDGILRHYDYNVIIIGTSMCENFKASQWNKLSGNNTIKAPFFGASYRELHDTLERAFLYKDTIDTIIWGVDFNMLTSPWDAMKYDSYPDYLYDNSIINDGNYLWNKTVLMRGLLPDLVYTIFQKESTNFDEYASWEEASGKDVVLRSFTPGEDPNGPNMLSLEQKEQIKENVQKNICELAKAHPETDFYLFFTPYSIAYWDGLYFSGQLDIQLEAAYIFAEQLLEYENVKLFCFFDNYDMICDLDNYVDAGHYIGDVNDQILDWMANSEYLLTTDNYQERIKKIGDFYKNFDYRAYWKGILERKP